MAAYDLAIDGYVPAVANWLNVPLDASNLNGIGVNLWSMGPPGPIPVTVYKMRGMDAAIDGTYDTWLVSSAPDMDASDYHGALATPLRDVIVVDSWTT